MTVWRALSQLVMAMESENAASSRCGERMRIFIVLSSRVERFCPGGRASCAESGHFVTCIPFCAGFAYAGPRVARRLFLRDMVLGLGPVDDEVVDDDVADAVCGVERRQVGAVLAHLGLGEALGGGGADALLVEVRRSAQDEDAVDVDFVRVGEPGKGLEGSGVFHATDGVGSVSVSLIFDPVACPLVKQLAMPEGGGREIVATKNEGRPMGGGFCVLHAALLHLRSVGKRRVFSEREGPVNEGGVEVVDTAVIAEACGAGLLVRGGLAEGNVAGLPIFWDLAGVDLVGEVAVDDIVGPDGRA